MIISFKHTFGFHNNKTVVGNEIHKPQVKEAKKAAKLVNFLRFLGYIPLFGLIAGYAFSISALRMKDQSTSVKTSYIMRGFLSAIGAGALLFVPDLLMTAYRFTCQAYRGRLTPFSPHN